MWRELQPGDPELIGPYRLRGLLGTGGMGRVFLGVSAGGRLVAVKVIRADLAASAEFRTRFQREVAVARKVSGLFTAPVIDADLDGPVPWLATAYVAGPSLADAVAEHGPLPVASVRELAAGLAEGLSAIHAAGVVHRDLKPANVLLKTPASGPPPATCWPRPVRSSPPPAGCPNRLPARSSSSRPSSTRRGRSRRRPRPQPRSRRLLSRPGLSGIRAGRAAAPGVRWR